MEANFHFEPGEFDFLLGERLEAEVTGGSIAASGGTTPRRKACPRLPGCIGAGLTTGATCVERKGVTKKFAEEWWTQRVRDEGCECATVEQCKDHLFHHCVLARRILKE